MTLIHAETNDRSHCQASPEFDVGYALIVERLLSDFDGGLNVAVVASVVRQCRQDLCCVPEAAGPEMTERLARVRLSQLVPLGDDPADR